MQHDGPASLSIGNHMIAERQREIAVSITALRMMQKDHGNRYFSFKCVSPEEETEWYRKAEEIVPPVNVHQ